MRIETPHWTISGGSHIGHSHIFKRTNCQDAFGLASWKTSAWGVVCDGCGSGRHSEVGANLLCQAACREISRLVQKNYPPNKIPDILFQSLIRLIDLNQHFTAPAYEEIGETARYIEDYWLATIFGFIFNKNELVIFNAGDGVFVLGDEIREIDQNNSPKYLGYACLRQPQLVGVGEEFIPREFDVRLPGNKFAQTNQIMVATDGFSTINESKWNQAAPHDLSLHGSQWGTKGKTGFQRWMNAQSIKGHFEDDCAIVIAERKPDDPESSD